jgi:hypothetical protein
MMCMFAAQDLRNACLIGNDVTASQVPKGPRDNEMKFHVDSPQSDGECSGIDHELTEQHRGFSCRKNCGIFDKISEIASE